MVVEGSLLIKWFRSGFQFVASLFELMKSSLFLCFSSSGSYIIWFNLSTRPQIFFISFFPISSFLIRFLLSLIYASVNKEIKSSLFLVGIDNVSNKKLKLIITVCFVKLKNDK